jgi:hypothetical protein
MFEKIGRLAEAAASNVSVSRRGFFGQLGRGALVVAGALGGLLGAAAPVGAAPPGTVTCCGGRKCKPPAQGCVFAGDFCGNLYSRRRACYWLCGGPGALSSACD